MKVTAETLRNLNACSSQVELFTRLYPDGLEGEPGTPEAQTVLDAAAKAGLDVGWFFSKRHLSGIARYFHPDGQVRREWHYQSGELQDPADGTPAVRDFYQDGQVCSEWHCQADALQDPADGTPAARTFDSNGQVSSEWHYQAGVLQELRKENPCS